MTKGTKRKADSVDPKLIKSNEEIEQMGLCYYCDRHFPDLKALQDHLKSKHLYCQVSRPHSSFSYTLANFAL